MNERGSEVNPIVCQGLVSTDLSELPCHLEQEQSFDDPTAPEGVPFSKEGHLDTSSGRKEQHGPTSLFKAARVAQTSLNITFVQFTSYAV